MQLLQTQPTRVDHKQLHFLIMDAPSESNLPLYLEELKRNKVTDVVRVCDPTYNAEILQRAGITVHDMPFDDGEAPPTSILNKWLSLCDERFEKNADACIAVHCVAGLGRAPVLVAVALMEEGMEAEDAVQLIRKGRRGAINSKQLRFLQKYKPRSQKGCCVIA